MYWKLRKNGMMTFFASRIPFWDWVVELRRWVSGFQVSNGRDTSILFPLNVLSNFILLRGHVEIQIAYYTGNNTLQLEHVRIRVGELKNLQIFQPGTVTGSPIKVLFFVDLSSFDFWMRQIFPWGFDQKWSYTISQETAPTNFFFRLIRWR